MELYPGMTPAQVMSIPTTLRYRIFRGKAEIEKRKEDAQRAAMANSRRRR